MIESLKRNGKGMLMMLVSAICLAVGQLMWKLAGASDFGAFLADGLPGLWKLFLALLPGFIIYGIGAIVMTIGLGYGELSVLQPMNSLSYVFALILTVVVLSEPVSPLMVIGVFVIIAGVMLMGGSSK